MKTNNMYITKILLLLMLPLFFSQCDKDEDDMKRYNRYTKCIIAGKEYKNSEHVLPVFRAPFPIVSYEYKEQKGTVSLYTDCVPKGVKDASETSILGLKFVIFLKEPLKINTKYRVESLPDQNYLMSYGTDKEYDKASISYSYLNIFNTMKDYSFGDGFVEFTKIDIDNDVLEGVFEIEFPFSLEKSDKTQTIKTQGEFRGKLLNK